MKRMRQVIAVLLASVFLTMPVQAEAMTPILLTAGDVTETVDDVTYTIRKDFNHPYVEYTSAYGEEYNRQLVVEMTLTNRTGAPLGYMAYLSAEDANGEELECADPYAMFKVGIVENGRAASVVMVYLLTEDNDVSSIELCYPPTDVSLTVNNPMQQPGVGGADRRSAIKGSILK